MVEGASSARRIGGGITGRLLATLTVEVGTDTDTAGGGGAGDVGASGATVKKVLTTRGAGSSLSAVTEWRTQNPTTSA